MWFAAETGFRTIIQLLSQRDDIEVDSRDNFDRTPLSYAAEGGHEVVVRALLWRGAEADSTPRAFRTSSISALFPPQSDSTRENIRNRRAMIEGQ